VEYRSSYEKTAHLYDLFDNKPKIEFFCHHASGMNIVLGIGCGTGRITLPHHGLHNFLHDGSCDYIDLGFLFCW
jgi:hypothetical protein